MVRAKINDSRPLDHRMHISMGEPGILIGHAKPDQSRCATAQPIFLYATKDAVH